MANMTVVYFDLNLGNASSKEPSETKRGGGQYKKDLSSQDKARRQAQSSERSRSIELDII